MKQMSKSESKMQLLRNYLLFAVAIASLCQRCSSHDCSTPLRNKVVYEGSSVSFEREYNAEITSWKIMPSFPSSAAFPFPMQITKDDGSVADIFVDTFALNQSQLTIFNSTVVPQGCLPYSTAGVYGYKYQNGDCETGAGLMVIRSGPVCRSTPETLFCQVDVAGGDFMEMKPIMTWKDNSGTTVKSEIPRQWSPVADAPSLKRWISEFPVSYDDYKQYECQLTFSSPSADLYKTFARNQPDFSASCYATKQPPTAWICSDENLPNIVVNEGVATTFPRLNNGQWQVFPASVPYNLIKNITNCVDVKPEFNATYAVSRSNLTIFKSTLVPEGSTPYSTAGLYIMKDSKPNCTKAANLVVIRSGPVCECNATNPDTMTLSCSAIFAVSSTQPTNPVFTWKKCNGDLVKQQQPNPTQFASSIKRSMLQIPIPSNDKAKYECEMTFSAPPKSPYTYINPNAPSFKASCSVSCV